jgi:hypothetical protein
MSTTSVPARADLDREGLDGGEVRALVEVRLDVLCEGGRAHENEGSGE